MPLLDHAGCRLHHEALGRPDSPPLLLVMGLGLCSLAWDDLPERLSKRFRVIVFDNRGVGKSTAAKGRFSTADLADDAVKVLDAHLVPRASVFGVSMGGMIAQVLAALVPQRVLTLTSIMSSSGNPAPRVAFGDMRALQALLRPPPEDPADIDAIVDHLVFVFGVIGSPGFAQDATVLRPHLERVARRGLYPAGTARQLGAILASGDRRPMLRNVESPTLVIHGASDPLVPVAAGRDTARHIRGATLEVVEGMGHDFPPALMTRIATRVADHCHSGGLRQGESESAA